MDNLNLTIGPTRELPDEFYQRLSKFYVNQCGSEEVSHIWNDIFNLFHKTLHDSLMSGSDMLQIQLGKIYEGLTLFGVDFALDMFVNSDGYKQKWWDILKATANNLAIQHIDNPEQPVEHPVDLEFTIAGIESALGISLTRMGGGGMFGVDLNGRFIPHHLVEAAGIAGSVKRYFKHYGIIPKNILELGAGVGNLCLVLKEMFANYHTVDLPIMSVMQAYLLAIHFSPEKIWFAGEPRSDTHAIFIHGIKPSEFLASLQFALAVNQDSLPEIPYKNAAVYAHMIETQLVPGGLFLSINHESSRGDQINVHDLFGITNLSLAHRTLYWGRAGYVEELWRKC